MSIELDLKTYLDDLKRVRKLVSCVKTKDGQVNSKVLREDIESISKKWFLNIRKQLTDNGFPVEDSVIANRDSAFTHLLKLCAVHGNKQKAYRSDIDVVITRYRQELITPLQTRSATSATPMEEVFNELLKEISSDEQNKYLAEAVACAKNGYLKASVVLGWCACIDHIQSKLDRIGYETFNITSGKIAGVKVGRFKHFSGTANITDLNQLREISDKNILSVIEGMGLVDYNEGTRLKSCLEMRNHSGHPGEAPITPYNVMSFFSDISKIVLLNPRFD